MAQLRALAHVLGWTVSGFASSVPLVYCCDVEVRLPLLWFTLFLR